MNIKAKRQKINTTSGNRSDEDITEASFREGDQMFKMAVSATEESEFLGDQEIIESDSDQMDEHDNFSAMDNEDQGHNSSKGNYDTEQDEASYASESEGEIEDQMGGHFSCPKSGITAKCGNRGNQGHMETNFQ